VIGVARLATELKWKLFFHCIVRSSARPFKIRSIFLKTELSPKAFSKPSTDAFSATSKNHSFLSIFQIGQKSQSQAKGQSALKLFARVSLSLGLFGISLTPLCEGVSATRTVVQDNNHVVISSANSAYQGTDAGLINPPAVAQRVTISQTVAPRYTSTTSTVAPTGVQLSVPAPRTNVIPGASRVATGSSYGSEQISTSLIWPTKGTLSSRYGRRWGKMHQGIDIAGPIGTPVVAAADGVVIASGFSSGGYGNVIDIQHPDGSFTRYGHNNRLIAGVGQTVKQGQHISDMGNTGRSTGPHLHFEFHPAGGSAINPIAYLPR
jgi:murein DD-endopeptidase MepM/ murein hydrolase activator NlpD